MPTCIIDGKKAEFQAGENFVEVAKRVGIEIPVFCYHPGLTVVAQCRMCMIEVKGMPKLQTACSTEPRDGMEIYTKSEAVVKQQEAVMEFLLVNHPLDCPICDKAGECDLQDHSYDHGSAYMRTTEDRRTYIDLDMGPVIQKNMNRCIHCTRCIRFGDEIANMREMVALQRGNRTEIATLEGRSLETDYAGNYSDICPTGSLTLKDFRYRKRAWMLKKTPTICEGCSRGCNMEIQWDGDQIYRCIPRENLEINRYWLCDDGRFNYQYTIDPTRVSTPLVQGKDATWGEAVGAAKSLLGDAKPVFAIGSDLTQEEAKLILSFVEENFNSAPVLHFGTPGVTTTQQDGDADEILKRKSQTSNLNGLEKLGIKPLGQLPSGTKTVFVLRGGRAVLPKLTGVKKVGWGVFLADEANGFDVILPGLSFAEKSGTVLNWEGREQKLEPSIAPPHSSKPLSEVLMIWKNSKEASRPPRRFRMSDFKDGAA